MVVVDDNEDDVIPIILELSVINISVLHTYSWMYFSKEH